MTFVFLGSISEVHAPGTAGIKLTRFGQRIDLPEELAEQTKMHGGLPCIPAEQFDGLGFTPAELKKYALAASHDRHEIAPDGRLLVFKAPDEFLEKKRQALTILHEIREAHAAELAAKAAEPVPVAEEGK